MSGRFGESWVYLIDDLWIQLSDYASDGIAAPEDLFGDLYSAASDFIAPSPLAKDLEEVRNDPMIAKKRFLSLTGTDFRSEIAIVQFLERAQEVVAQYDLEGFESAYRRLLRDAVLKFNLRYRLDEPFDLRFLLPGSFVNLYSELHRAGVGNSHLTNLLLDFEKAFDRYARTLDETDLKTCIGKASNYAEGLASITVANPRVSNTMGSLAAALGVWPHDKWPHDKVRAALVDLYVFCSDYPGIRHGGTPTSALRDLASRSNWSPSRTSEYFSSRSVRPWR